MSAPRIVPDDPAGRAEAIRVLRAGGLVALPTDTVYGVAFATSTPDGLERVFAAKRRPPDRAIVLLLADAEQSAMLGTLGSAGEALARTFWPGGLTLVVPRLAGAAPTLALSAGGPADRTVGVRVPDHATPRELARAVGPLPTTSANRSGEAEARDAADVAAQLGDSLDLILDGGPAGGPRPSTVVDVSEPAIRVLREGAVPWESIAAALHSAGLGDPVGR
jgi:L-threonylcarbamoyladenylate synthase